MGFVTDPFSIDMKGWPPKKPKRLNSSIETPDTRTRLLDIIRYPYLYKADWTQWWQCDFDGLLLAITKRFMESG